MKNFFNNLTIGGKILLVLVVAGLIFGGDMAYVHLFPKKAKSVIVTTQAAIGIPPLAYDKNANAPFRKLPDFNSPADVQSPEMRGQIMGWNAFAGANYAVGGTVTSIGSICEELGLNVRLTVQNSCSEQGNQLYAFAQAVHGGQAQPTTGCHFINWMGDGCPSYLAGLNARLIKDFGPEYRAEVVTITGTSFNEDKWMLKTKFQKDARGSLTACVIRDGDWDIAVEKSQLMGWECNHDLGTWDKNKVNFVAAPNDDYVEAGKMYNTGQKVTLHIVENGKLTGRDTIMAVSGVASWFPVDQQIVQGKGGMITEASTKEFSTQMGCAILVIKKWADDNQALVDKLIEAFGRGGDQIKSHEDALIFASKVSEVVFADKEKTANDWYKAFKSFPLSDEDGNEVIIGGSRAFSIADAANYVGLSGGTDKYKQVYNTFGNIDKESYPEIVPNFPDYDDVTDWSFLKRVYAKTKQAGTAGSISKTDFTSATKGAIVGDANYSIQFNTGSAEIKPVSFPVLNKVLGQLVNADNTFVEVDGHTDNTGDATANISLSQQRAESVKQYLISQDADLAAPNKLSVKGFGQTAPLSDVDPNSATGRTKNRRVEIKLSKVKS